MKENMEKKYIINLRAFVSEHMKTAPGMDLSKKKKKKEDYLQINHTRVDAGMLKKCVIKRDIYLWEQALLQKYFVP